MRNLGKLTLKEVGQEMSVITQSDALRFKGGDGSTVPYYGSSVTYTWEQYLQIESDGRWDGGYVEGHGFMCETVTVFNMSGSYTTLNDFSGSQINSGWDTLISTLAGEIPGYSIAESGVNNQAWTIMNDLLKRGYDGNDNLFFHPVIWGSGGLFGIEVYDAETGNFINVY